MADNSSKFNYMALDYEGLRTSMINLLKVKMPEYTDLSSSDAGIVLIELFAFMIDLICYDSDITANEMLFHTAQERESIIDHAKRLCYNPINGTPSKVHQVIEIVPQAEDFIITKGTQFKVPATSTNPDIYFEADADFSIPAGKTGLEKDESGNYIYQIPLTQGITIPEDILGTGNGTPGQKFSLNSKPVIQDSLVLYLDDGSGLRKWNLVPNFIDSNTSSEDYCSDVDADDVSTITFGDNYAGKSPTTIVNGIVATYRIGGGSVGNIAANAINQLALSRAEVVQTFNPSIPYEMGVEKESNAEIRKHALENVRTLWRAVTLKDFEDLINLNLNDIVLLVKAIQNADPFSINLYLVPKTGTNFTNEQLQTIVDFLLERKLIGITINLKDAVYHPVNPTVHVIVFPQYHNQLTTIQENIQTELAKIFTLGNYNFGQSFVSSDIIQTLKAVTGVNLVYIDENYVTAGETEVITLGTPTITMTEGA
jgi:hypothetical protein